MFTTLIFTSSVHGRLSLCRPQKHTSGTKKVNFEEVTADDEGFLEGGSPNHRGSSAYGSPSVVKDDEPRFVDGGRRNAANPWNLDKLKTPLLALEESFTRPHDDLTADADLSLKSLMADMEEQAERTREMLKILSEATGMPIVQENGQRRYGPPLDCTTPPPRGSEVFVGKIPRDALEPELVPVFSKAGRIYELRLMMDFSGTNRGYCFVQYFTPEEAHRAVMMLNHFEIRRGRPIGVSKSVDNCRLFVGGIPFDKQENDILNEIKLITDGVVRVIVYQNPKNYSENRGYAFVEYESHKAAAMARRKMIPGNIQLFGCDVAVDWAEPESDQKRALRRNRQNPTTSPKTRQPKTNNKQPLALPCPGSIVNYPPNINYNFGTYNRYQQPTSAPFAANYKATYDRFRQTANAPFIANYKATYDRFQQPVCSPFAANFNATYNRYQEPASASFAANYKATYDRFQQPACSPFAANYDATSNRYQQAASAPFAANYDATSNRYQQAASAPFAANYDATFNRYQPAWAPVGAVGANYNARLWPEK